MKYTGEKCFSCNETFIDEDDVVVCPDCGTPYHRNCYKEAGECVNHVLHENKGRWKAEEKEKKAVVEEQQSISCPRCKATNEKSSKICRNCGMNLDQNEASQNNTARQFGGADLHSVFEELDVNKQTLGFNPDEDFGGATLKEVSNFVNTNTFYYIPIFKRMKEAGTKISFNFICLFFPYFYFANRKMWFWALLTSIITVILDIPTIIYYISTQEAVIPILQDIVNMINSQEGLIISLTEICNMAGWIVRVLVCLFSNWLYFKFSVRSVKKLKARYGGPVSPQKLRETGGVSPVNILIIGAIFIALSFVVYFVLMAALMFIQQSGIMG